MLPKTLVLLKIYLIFDENKALSLASYVQGYMQYHASVAKFADRDYSLISLLFTYLRTSRRYIVIKVINISISLLLPLLLYSLVIMHF